MNINLPIKNQPTVIVEATTSNDISSLDTNEIKGLFKEHGAILFRGFSLDIDKFSNFSDRFCKSFVSNESPGREVLSKDGRVQTVNLGQLHFLLHPEISREPWQPDIAFFACETPSSIGGETTVCDGVAVVKAFSPELFSHLKSSKLAHTVPTTLDWGRKFLNKPEIQLSELLDDLSYKSVHFSMKDKELFRTYVRPMLHKPMFTDELAYGNFLVFARRRLQISYFPCYLDGSEILDNIVDEIENITNQFSSEIKWQKNDLVMLDNTRFMHGRNPIGDPQKRRIYTQFGYSSFAPKDHPNMDCQPL